jgi:hypothetical protein
MSDDQVWNAFISAIPAQDKARHDLENFQARLLKNALQEIEDLKLEIIQHRAEIVQLEEVLQGYSSLLHDVTQDRDRFPRRLESNGRGGPEMAQITEDDHYKCTFTLKRERSPSYSLATAGITTKNSSITPLSRHS